jgi:hypothetical protein
VRRDLALGELAHARLYLFLFFVQIEIHKRIKPSFVLAARAARTQPPARSS